MTASEPPGAITEATRRAMRAVGALLQQGNYRAAREHLETIARAHPGYAEAQRLLGGTQLALGDAAGAEQTLRHAIALDPGWTPTVTTLAELLLTTGRFPEAEALLRQAATAGAPDPRARILLARYCNDTARAHDALELATSVAVDGRVPPELASQRLRALIALGQGAQAIAECRVVAQRAPANEAAQQLLAVALAMTGSHREAEPLLRRRLQRSPTNAALRFAHARSLTALGELEQAEEAWRQGLQSAPQDADAQNQLARLVWIRSGNRRESVAELDRALARFANNDALWATKAAVLQATGDVQAAWECLAPRVHRTQAAPRLIVRGGLTALEFDSQLALKLAERAHQADATSVSAQTLRAAALLGVGDAHAALAACRSLRQQAPNDQYLIALQTVAWRMLGDARYARWCDYSSLVVPYRLEPPSGWAHLSDFLHDLATNLGKLHATMAHRRLFQSLRHGTETVNDLAQSDDPVIQALFHAFDAPIRDYMARVGTGADPLRVRNVQRYRFNGGWSVRLHEQGFHNNHVHPSGWISSACYIALPQRMASRPGKEGILTFAAPGLLTRSTLPSQYEIRPEPGMLVLFPSYAWHGTVPFGGDDTRLTVAFDAIPEPRS